MLKIVLLEPLFCETFLQFFIKYYNDGTIILEGLFKKIHPFKVSIRAFEKEEEENIETNSMDSLFIIHSSDELLTKSISQNARINQRLTALSKGLEIIIVNRKHFVVTFFDASVLKLIIETLGDLHNEFVNLKTG